MVSFTKIENRLFRWVSQFQSAFAPTIYVGTALRGNIVISEVLKHKIFRKFLILKLLNEIHCKDNTSKGCEQQAMI